MTNYDLGANRVTAHWLALSASPPRPSTLRSLCAMTNTFANESFMDELALAEVDPLEFRLRHLNDPRVAAVLQTRCPRVRLAGPNNTEPLWEWAGRRNPDGFKNQIEGKVIKSASRPWLSE